MNGHHQNDITPIRTFADDIKHVKGDSGSTNTAINFEQEEATQSEQTVQPEPPKVPPAPESVPPAETVSVETMSMAGKGIEKSAFDYLAQKNKPAEPAVSDPAPGQTLNYRSTPAIQDTDVALAVDNIAKNNQSTILYDEGLVNIDADLEAGTIIQDKKRKNWKLVPAMGRAAADWYKDKEKDFVESRQPTHTITKSEARLDTIQAAAEASKLAPTADYQSVAEKLREQEYEVSHTGIQLKDEKEVPPPGWTYVIEDEPAAAPAQPATANVAKADPTPQPEPVVENTPVTNTRPETDSQSANENVSSDREETTTEPIPMEEKMIYPEDQQEEYEPTQDIQTQYPDALPDELVSEASTLYTQPIASSYPEPFKKLQKTVRAMIKPPDNERSGPWSIIPNPAQLPIYIFVVGFLSVSVLGMGVGLYMFTTANEQAAVEQEEKYEPLLKAKDIRITIDPKIESIVDKLIVAEQKNGINSFRFRTNNNTPLTPDQVMANLVPQELNSLSRNTQNLAIGFNEAERPYLMVKGNNFETLFGGLLSWEATMNRDLAPLFGPAINQAGLSFKDEVLLNRSARVLYDHGGNEVLLYMFVNSNTVIIATDRGDIINLIPHLN